MSTNPNIITLDKPIKRGETEITSIELRRPDSGALRGTSLRELLDMYTDPIIKVLPRISEPTLTPQEANSIDPADLAQIGMVIASFLLPKRVVAEAEAQLLAQNSPL